MKIVQNPLLEFSANGNIVEQHIMTLKNML